MPFTKFPHIKRVVTLHGLDVVFPNIFFQRYILPAFNQFDLMITVSRATADAAVQRGLSPKKIMAIPNGVDVSINPELLDNKQAFDTHFKQQYGQDISQRKILIALGRPVKRKGFSWFITQVMPLLDEQALLILIGPYQSGKKLKSSMHYLPSLLRKQIELLLGLPSDESTILKLLALPEYKKKVMLLGKLPFAEIKTLLSQAAAFVMPNIKVNGDMEGFGLVCLEACLCGATVFAADMDGIPDAIHHGKNGYLLPSEDAAAWANTVNLHLQNRTNNQQLPENARAYTVNHFGWDRMVKAYHDCFLQIRGEGV